MNGNIQFPRGFRICQLDRNKLNKTGNCILTSELQTRFLHQIIRLPSCDPARSGPFDSVPGAIGHEHDLCLTAVCIINDPKFVALSDYLSYLHYYYIRSG
ncbi:hypothetical protein JTB14_031260 [Gonioctena quinquepunctata]|nr:hypothetical protein JTB14_031260 [Gonioctena quinquepunctata]